MATIAARCRTCQEFVDMVYDERTSTWRCARCGAVYAQTHTEAAMDLDYGVS